MIRRIAILAGLLVLTPGCRPDPAPQPTEPARSEFHLRTPRVNVDVEGKGTSRGTEVDVKRKDH